MKNQKINGAVGNEFFSMYLDYEAENFAKNSEMPFSAGKQKHDAIKERSETALKAAAIFAGVLATGAMAYGAKKLMRNGKKTNNTAVLPNAALPKKIA